MSESDRWLIRPVERRDVDALVALAQALGPGMTTLPADAETIARKVDSSILTFAGKSCDDQQFILVLEDGGRVLGLSGVYPTVGTAHGFFSYKLTRLIQRSVDLGRRLEVELLTLSNDYTGATEIGTLAVLPQMRGSTAGRLLARARYMLIGAFPHLFAERVMAEMRGWQDDAGQSPFWNAIGARFFDMPFDHADRLSAVQGAGFIADLMPKQPIYTALLPADARAAIGRAHDVSAKAMAMLKDEDFRYEAHVDVFDGGPQVHVQREHIRTIRETVEHAVTVHETARVVPLLVSNQSLEAFRVIQTVGATSADSVLLPAGALSRLGLRNGETVRAAPGRTQRIA